jgi:hypothetical protein
MMKPGERFVLLRTGERYVVDDNGALFNESANRSARLHGNCWVKPIHQRKAYKMDVFKEIEKHGLELHGDIEYFAELVRADEREVCVRLIQEGTDEPMHIDALRIVRAERERLVNKLREGGA